MIINKNSNKLFNMEKDKVQRYTTKCICPCGGLFRNWHNQSHINLFPNFKTCEDKVFDNHMEFIAHLYSKKEEYYHQTILRLVQSTYSVLLTKYQLKMGDQGDEFNKQTFSSIHKGNVTLPSYQMSDASYKTFTIVR